MDASQFSKSFEEVSSRYMEEYARNVERYVQFVSGIASKAPKPPLRGTIQERYAEFVRTEGPKVSGTLAEAGLNYYKAVLNTGIEVASRFMEGVILPEKKTAPGSGAGPAALLFQGRPGDSPTNAFAVSNDRNQPVAVRFETTELRAEDGSAAFKPEVTFSPDSCVLGARAEQVVRCSILLTEQFRPGQIYRGQIQVVGFPDMTMNVSVRVEEDAADKPAPEKEPPQKGRMGGSTPKASTGTRKKKTARKTKASKSGSPR
jgi:hypothetical protein